MSEIDQNELDYCYFDDEKEVDDFLEMMKPYFQAATHASERPTRLGKLGKVIVVGSLAVGSY